MCMPTKWLTQTSESSNYKKKRQAEEFYQLKLLLQVKVTGINLISSLCYAVNRRASRGDKYTVGHSNCDTDSKKCPSTWDWSGGWGLICSRLINTVTNGNSLPYSQEPATEIYPESVQILTPYFSKLHFNIIFPSMSRSPRWSLPVRFRLNFAPHKFHR